MSREEFSTCISGVFSRSACLLLVLFVLGEGFCLSEIPETARFERIGPYGGTVRSLLVSPKDSRVVYLGTSDGQLFKSKDGGVSWILLYPGIKLRQFVIDSIVECLVNSPGSENHLFAGTSTGLYESQDGGNIWERVPAGLLNVSISSIVFLDSTGRRILAADNTFGGVMLSEDAGNRWEKIEDPEFSSPVRRLMQDSSHPSIIYVGTSTESVYRLSLKAF